MRAMAAKAGGARVSSSITQPPRSSAPATASTLLPPPANATSAPRLQIAKLGFHHKVRVSSRCRARLHFPSVEKTTNVTKVASCMDLAASSSNKMVASRVKWRCSPNSSLGARR